MFEEDGLLTRPMLFGSSQREGSWRNEWPQFKMMEISSGRTKPCARKSFSVDGREAARRKKVKEAEE